MNQTEYRQEQRSRIPGQLDFAQLAEGQRSGLFCAGNLYNGIGVIK